MIRKTLYGTLTQEELNENEKAMLYIKECAESVGLEVIEGKTAFDIQFMAEVMKRLREKLEPCTDTISRQAAINAFERFINELGIKDEPYNYGEMALSVQNVPSVSKAKKRRKQQEHESQICAETISRLPELVKNMTRAMVDYIKQAYKAVNEMSDRIKTMPDDEFEQFCKQLDLQQAALARRIRMKGRDANE